MNEFFKSIVDANTADYKDFIGDVQRHGCASGCVSELAYYSQTDAIFDQYEVEIIEWAEESGFEDMVKGGLIKRWDTLFGLRSPANRQLLVWSAFEDFVSGY